MLRCGHCDVICDNYEDWLSHLVTEGHQATLGMSEVFCSPRNQDRNERSILVFKMNPTTHPYEVVTHFAKAEPLGFVTDAYVHIFPNVNEKFYLIVYDQKKFVERFCTLQERCGDQKVVTSMVHCQSKAGLSEKEWEAKIASSFFYRRHEHLKRTLNDLVWEQQLTLFLNIVSLGESGYQEREKVMDELESLIREEYENATVNPFGSCTTWLADINADLDVYVDAIGNGGKTDIDQDTREEVMIKITRLLRRRYDGRNVIAIRHTRVPIIKLDHPSGLKVDFSFENCLSVQNSKMIRLMTKLDYRIRPFLMFLRYWARFHNMIGPQSVKSYALILMALVYLRKKKIIPTVHDLQIIEGTRPCLVSGWNATFCNNREIIQSTVRGLKCIKDPPSTDRNAQDIMQFVYGFFAEYAAFDFETQVICPLVGEFLPKASFDSLNGVDLPKEMGLLKANLVTGQCTQFNTQRPLCIQDPFTLNVNVTSSCHSSELIYKFKAACAMAAEALKPFASSYDSADKEGILELCCQQITIEKQQEVMMQSRKPEEDHDNMAYVKTEATTTTNEDANFDEFLQSCAAPDNNNSSSDALQSIKDFYKDEYNYKAFSKSEEKNQIDRPSSSRDSLSYRGDRDTGRDNSTRVQRISMFDDLEKTTTSSATGPESEPYAFYPGYTVPTSPDPSPDESKNTENPLKKALKSIIVVAQKGVHRKTESRSDKSPVRTHTSPSKKKVAAKESTSSSTITKEKSSSSKDKSLKDIVILVENNSGKRETNDVHGLNDSKTSAEPIVKFISSSVPEDFQSFCSSQTSSSRSPTPTEPSTPPGHQSKASLNEPEESPLINEQVVQFINDLEAEVPLQQIPPPEISVRFDDNYGYAIKPQTPFSTSSKPKTVSQVEVPVQKPKLKTIVPYVPPNKRTEIRGEASGSDSPITSPPQRDTRRSQPAETQGGSELYFPAFVIHLSEDFYKSFYTTLGSLSMYEVILLMKMKVFWVNAAVELFMDTQLWERIRPIMEKDSFTSVKLEPDKALLIFEEVERRRADLLNENPSAYMPNRKRLLATGSSSAEAISQAQNEQGPSAKLRKTSSDTNLPAQLAATDSSPSTSDLSYQIKSALLLKLGKVPANVRRKYAQACFFRCHPSIITLLHGQWMSMSGQLSTKYPGSSPLEMLGKVCEQIQLTLPRVPPAEEWVNVKLLIAFDTSGEPPGLYFGFEYEHRTDDPTYDKQAGIHVSLETILKDLIEAHAKYKMVKYFKL